VRKGRSKSAPVGVIGKVLLVLELLDQSPDGLQLKDISSKTGINKSTVHRFLSHLEGEGYLFRDGSGTYMLGPKLARLGNGASQQALLRNICRPTLEALWKATGETINLGILDGRDVLYVNVLETTHTFRLVSQPGIRRPYYCTSLGKAIIANMEDGPLKEELLNSIKAIPKSSRPAPNLVLFRKELLQIREQGFSIDNEEAVTGVYCVGAAVFGVDQKVVGAISVSCPTVRLTAELLPDLSKTISKAAKQISRKLGAKT
jgi:DNA-binding IclR family transcriptional regulator